MKMENPYEHKDAHYYEELISKLHKDYEDLHKYFGYLSQEEMIEKEKELDKKIEEARKLYNECLEREAEKGPSIDGISR